MKKNKAFTLVELLAVVVILAIIALIAIPIINKSIYTSQKETAEIAVNKYIEAVETALSGRNLKGKEYLTSCQIISDGSGDLLCDNNEKLHVDIKGLIPISGKLTIDKLDVKSFDNINFEGFVFSRSENSSETNLVGNYSIRYVNITGSSSLQQSFAKNDKLNITFNKDEYGEYPDNITITAGDKKLTSGKEYTYDNQTGKLTTNSINSNITITGIDKYYTITYTDLTSGTVLNNLPKTIKKHDTLSITLPKDQFNEYPYQVSIVMGGITLDENSSYYSYSNTTGLLVIENVTGLLNITGKDKFYNVTYITEDIKGTKKEEARRNYTFDPCDLAGSSCRFNLPDVTIIMGNTTLTPGTGYKYDKDTGKLEIYKVTDDIKIIRHYTVTYHDLPTESPRTPTIAHGYNINITFPVDEDGLHPYNVLVNKDGFKVTSGYTYTYSTGNFVMNNVTGSIDITGVEKYWDLDYLGVDCASSLKNSIKNDTKPTIDISCNPVDIEVKMGSTVLTKGTHYTYSSGKLVFKTNVTDNVLVTGYYTVTYKANGDTKNPATVNPTSVNVKYDTNTTLPTATRDGFTQLGWGANATTKSYETNASYKVTKNQTLYAIWEDTTKPTVTITRKDYNTFSWSATDNDAVKGVAITTSSTAPSEFNLTTTSGTYDIDDKTAQTYYVWAKDGAGNINNTASITSYKMTKTQGEGTTLTLKEGSTSLGTTTVLKGTKIDVTASLSSGYRNLVLTKNGTNITSGTSHTIDAATTFVSSSTRYFTIALSFPTEVDTSQCATTVDRGATYTCQLKKDQYGQYPNITSASVGGLITTDYTYTNGLLTLSNVQGNISITGGFTYYTISYSGIGNSSSLKTSVRRGDVIPSFTASPIMPAVRVTMGGSAYTGFTYSSSTGTFTSTTAVTNNIVIYGRYTVSYSNCSTTNLPTQIDANAKYNQTMNKDTFGEYPANVLATMGGVTLSKGNSSTGYTYTNGVVTIDKATGNIALTCTDQYYNITYNYVTNSSSLITSIKRNNNLSITLPAKQPNVYVTMGGTALTSGNADSGYTYTASTGALVKNKVTGDISITGYYNVTYDVAGGSSVSNTNVKGGTNATLAAAPTRSGFSFQGWKADTDSTTNSAGGSYKVTKDVKFTAIWKDVSKPTVTLSRTDFNTIGITLKDNVGVTGWAVTTTSDAPTSWTTITSATSTTKSYDINASTAYTYYVWAVDATGNVSSAATMTSYKVTIEPGTGTTITVKEGSTSILTASGSKCVLSGTTVTVTGALNTGYTSLVLKKDGTTITNSSTHTITADTKFTSSATKPVTVSYSGCPTATETSTKAVGSAFKTQFATDTYGEYPYQVSATMNSIALVSGTGYTYSNTTGLFTLSGNLTGNVIITCSKQYHTITYKYITGSSSLVTSVVRNDPFSTTFTGKPPKVDVTMGGSSYTGFTYNKSDGTFSIGKVTGDLVIHGYYTVTFNSNGGSTVSAKEVKGGDTISTLPTPTKTAYTFKGWYKETALTNQFTTSTKVEKDQTLYAKWEDTEAPTVTLSVTDYNTIGITLKDNVGVTGWAVTTTSDKPTSWTTITSSTNTSVSYDIDASTAKTYYVWAKDVKGNESSSASITSYKITKSQGAGTTLTIKNGSTSIGTTCVLKGTSLTITATLDAAYKDLVLKYGSTSISSGSSQTVSAAVTISSSATLNQVTCAAGNYLKGGATSCTQCPAGSYCPGGTFNPSSSDQGKTACAAGKYSAAGASSCTACATGYTSTEGSSSCTESKYTLTINPNGGSYNGSTSSTTSEITYNSSVSVKNNPTKSNSVFNGWQLTSGNVDVTWYSESSTKTQQYIINSASATKPSVYNNSGGGTVTHTIISDSTSSTGYSMKIVTNGTASPGAGGYYTNTTSVAGGVYFHKIVAKVPTGYTLNIASNSRGVGSAQYWLTDNKGTGDWQTYLYATYCGYGGSFSTFGHVYASGSNNTSVTWYLREATMYQAAASKTAEEATSIILNHATSNITLTAQWSSTQVTCPAGQYLNVQSCATCPAGNYCTGGTWTATTAVQGKTACSAGTYRSATGGTAASSCSACGAGKYSGAGASSCSNISAGCYGTSATSSCPNKCSAGYYSKAGSSSCTKCSANTYSGAGAGSCTACATNYYSAAGASSCTFRCTYLDPNTGSGAPSTVANNYNTSYTGWKNGHRILVCKCAGPNAQVASGHESCSASTYGTCSLYSSGYIGRGSTYRAFCYDTQI